MAELTEEAFAKFVDGYLSELSRKYHVPKPEWRFANLDVMTRFHAACYQIVSNIILVNRAFIYYYSVNPKLTGDVVKFVLAHEFYHYTRFGQVPKRAIPRLLERLSKKEEDVKADEFAEKETGIPRSELSVMTFALRILTE